MNFLSLDDMSANPDMVGSCQSEIVQFSESRHLIHTDPEGYLQGFSYRHTNMVTGCCHGEIMRFAGRRWIPRKFRLPPMQQNYRIAGRKNAFFF